MPEFDLEPKLFNSFYRITLVNKSSVERITIDFDVKFNNYNGLFGQNESLVIIEVKQPQLNRTSPIIRALKNKLIRPQSLSKYCIGMVKTNQSIKYNRFKKHLNLINKKIA